MKYLKLLESNYCFDSRKCEGWDPTGVVSAGINFVGGLISNNTNKKLVRETNAQNLDIANRQMQLQKDQFQQTMDYQTMDWNRNRQAALEDWQREANYNSAAEQAARYKAAGLNPALMMQGQSAAVGNVASSTGSAPSAPSIPAAAQLQIPRDGFGDSVASAVDAYLRARSTESEANLKDVQAQQISIDNRSREQLNLAELSNRRAQLIQYRDNHKLSKLEYERTNKEIDLLDDQIALNFVTFDARAKQPELLNWSTSIAAKKIETETEILNIQKEFTRRMEQAKVNLTEAQTRGIAQDIVESGSRIRLNDANAAKAVAEEAKTILEAYDIIPGSPGYNQAKVLVESEIWKNNRTRVTGPFGSGLDINARRGGYNTHNPLGPYRNNLGNP